MLLNHRIIIFIFVPALVACEDSLTEQAQSPQSLNTGSEPLAAKEIGRETVQYVANILKYYIAYRLTIQQQLNRKQAREGAGIK